MKEKICESCGMPMRKLEEFGGKNPENKYCVYCTDATGNLKPYNEKLEDTQKWLMRANDLSEEKALELAKTNLSKMPAWKDMA